MSDHKTTIARFKNKSIFVIGDLILDQHIKGNVHRISPEAPVPIVLQEGPPTYAPGGAANVANNLKTLGANVALVGYIGDDPEGEIFLKELQRRKITTRGIFIHNTAPTTIKTRIIAQHQQMLRLDREKVQTSQTQDLHKKIINFVRNHITLFDAIIVSDYGKGMITAPLLAEVCQLAQEKKKIITVDPKVEHFVYYRGVTAITPNQSETENAIRNLIITQRDRRQLALISDKLSSYEDIVAAGTQLLRFLNLESLLITLGDEGMCLFEKDKDPVHIHTKAREVFDVTGAGDTVIAVFTLGLAAGASKLKAADLANYAAGVVVGKMGTATVTREELLEVIKEDREDHEVTKLPDR